MARGRKEHQAPPDSLSLGDRCCVAEAFACVRPRGNGGLGFMEMGGQVRLCGNGGLGLMELGARLCGNGGLGLMEVGG